MIKNKISSLILVLIVMQSVPCFSEIAVIVNPANDSVVNMKSIKKIFLGKSKSFSNGDKVAVFDLPVTDDTHGEFREKVLGKTEKRLNTYWAKMRFSSKAKQPKVLASPDEIKAMVANNPNAIAYLPAEDVDASVKVAFRIH